MSLDSSLSCLVCSLGGPLDFMLISVLYAKHWLHDLVLLCTHVVSAPDLTWAFPVEGMTLWTSSLQCPFWSVLVLMGNTAHLDSLTSHCPIVGKQEFTSDLNRFTDTL